MSNKQKWATVIIPTIIFLFFTLFATGQNGTVITEMQDNDGDGLHDEFTLVGGGVPFITISPANNWMGGTQQSIMSDGKSGVSFNVMPKTAGYHILRMRYISSHPLFVIVTTTNGYKYIIAVLPATSIPSLPSIEYTLPHKQKKIEISTKNVNVSWMTIDDIIVDPLGAMLSNEPDQFVPILIEQPINVNEFDILGRKIKEKK